MRRSGNAGITKREAGGKLRRYRNLASFNKECTKRGRSGNHCVLTNLRCTKNGGGLATVKSEHVHPRYSRGQKPPGTWLLHFADCSVMKGHLRGRVSYYRAGQLDGKR